VVEVRHAPLGAPAADVVDAGVRGALDLVDHVAVERRRLPPAGTPAAAGIGSVPLPHRAPQYSAAWSTWKLYSLRADPYRRNCLGSTPSQPARRSRSARCARCSSRIGFSTQSAPRLVTEPRTKIRAS